MKESYPLIWPDDWPRTLLRDREDRKRWGKTELQAIKALEKELLLFGAETYVLTRRDPNEIISAPDPSVSVLLTRKQEEDFQWQQVLDITSPTPTRQEIETAFKRKAAKYHPEGLNADLETYIAFNRHKQNALAYIDRLSGKGKFNYILPCDKFSQVRWNVIALANTIHSFRQMERDGTSRLLQRAMSGFAAQLTTGKESSDVVTSASR